MSTKKRLLKQCEYIARDLERAYEKEFWDEEEQMNYFEDVLGGWHRISLDGEYLGVTLMVAAGGPNIYIDTSEQCIKGYWGADYIEVHIPSEVAYAVSDWWKDWYEAS